MDAEVWMLKWSEANISKRGHEREGLQERKSQWKEGETSDKGQGGRKPMR